MSAGGPLSSFGKSWFAAGSAWQVFRVFTAPDPVPNASGPWRPPQWSQPQLYMITAITTDPSTGDQVPTNYFFDAVLRGEFSTRLRHTDHPIQNGANVSDHAYTVPAQVMLEIGMSDAMDRYVASLYTQNSSKSVSAYQTLLSIQKSKQPLTVTTRLNTWQNMLISEIRALESNRTRFGLRAIVTFEEILTSDIQVEPISSRPQTTDQNPQGTVNPDTDTSNYVDYQFVNKGPNIPGSGGWSSFGSSYQVQTGVSSGGLY